MEKQHRHTRIWTPRDRMPFGRYRGASLKWLAENHPGFLQWWQHRQPVAFSEELRDLIRLSLYLLK